MMSISTTEQDLRTCTKIITHTMHPRFPRPLRLATSRTATTNAIRHQNRIFVGLFVLLLCSCSLYITRTNGYLDRTHALCVRSDGPLCWPWLKANNMFLIIFCFNVMLIIISAGKSNQNMTSKTSTLSSKTSPTTSAASSM